MVNIYIEDRTNEIIVKVINSLHPTEKILEYKDGKVRILVKDKEVLDSVEKYCNYLFPTKQKQ